MKLSDEFYRQLGSIENFSKLDSNDSQVVAIRNLFYSELNAMSNSGAKQEVRKKRAKTVYNFYERGELLATGTANEIAEMTGIKASTVVKFGTPKYLASIDKSKNKYAERVGKK